MTGPPVPPRFIGRLEGFLGPDSYTQATGWFWHQTAPVTFVSASPWWISARGRFEREFTVHASESEPFSCDLESWDLADWRQTGLAGLLHDYLYRTGILHRAACDALYYEALVALDLPVWRRWARWAGVRYTPQAWLAWKRHRKQDGGA